MTKEQAKLADKMAGVIFGTKTEKPDKETAEFMKGFAQFLDNTNQTNENTEFIKDLLKS